MLPDISFDLGQNQKGSLHVICGSMFAGKTETLISVAKRARVVQKRRATLGLSEYKIRSYKPNKDDRYSINYAVSHDKNVLPGKSIEYPQEILDEFNLEPCHFITIEEAQFFSHDIVNICNELADRGCCVVVAGLEKNFLGQPFGPMPMLMAIAETITKLKAICTGCGGIANNSHLREKPLDNSIVVIGAEDKYDPLCRECYNKVRHSKMSV